MDRVNGGLPAGAQKLSHHVGMVVTDSAGGYQLRNRLH